MQDKFRSDLLLIFLNLFHFSSSYLKFSNVAAHTTPLYAFMNQKSDCILTVTNRTGSSRVTPDSENPDETAHNEPGSSGFSLFAQLIIFCFNSRQLTYNENNVTIRIYPLPENTRLDPIQD